MAFAVRLSLADDLLATNYHVVNQPSHQALAVRLFDGRLFMVEEVVAASRENDLAVLRIPLHRTQTHFSGSGSWWICQPSPNNVSIPPDSNPFHYGRLGASGAPVLNTEGHVVGIATSTESVYYSDLQMVFKHCIPVQQLRKLIGG